jgi:hypothetical protein
MRGSIVSSFHERRGRPVWFATLCVLSALFGSAAYADDDRREYGERFRSEPHSRVHERARERDHDGRHEHRRDWERRHEQRGYHRERDWRYYHGRYWAPAHYRGRRCSNRRHFHEVHYHVLARDYYDYYYPRYRYYGPRPSHASASVIITLPLF